MASTTAGQQQPVMIRGFEVGINPSMLTSTTTSLAEIQQQLYNQQQQQSLFSSSNHARQSSASRPSTASSVTAAAASSAFVIPHLHGQGRGMGNGNGNGATTEELIDLDGLQQSMASMDAHSHHHYAPRPPSTASNHSQGSAHAGSRPFEMARSPTYNWHGYRPGSSSNDTTTHKHSHTTSSPFDAFHAMPPSLARHVSSPSSFLNTQQQQQQQTASPHRSPLDIFPSPSVASALQLHPAPSGVENPSSSTPSASGNLYPFATAAGESNPSSTLDGRLSSFHRHAAHAQSNSYSSAFSPSTFLVNGLNSPTSLNPSHAFPQTLSPQHPNNSLNASTTKTTSPPLNDSQQQDSLQQGLNANNKRPGSTDSGHASGGAGTGANGRGKSDSPLEDGATGNKSSQPRGRSQGRTPASGKAPSARSSRSRTRRPSYSRTISPAGLRNSNTSPTTTSTAPSTTTNNQASSNTSTSILPGTSNAQSSFPNPYAPQLSPYMPGYPSLPSGNVDHILASQPMSMNQIHKHQHAYGVSAPTLSSAGLSFMQLSEEAQAQYRAHIHALQIAQSQVQAQAQALQEHQAMLQAQQTLAAAAAVSTARPSSSMSQHQGKEQSQPSTSTMKPAQKSKNDYDVQLEQLKRRTSSDASNFAPSSLGLGNLSTDDLLLNSPSAFTGPLPLPHQEGFRTGSTGGSSLPAYLNALGGPAVDGSKSGETEAGDALDMETTTRGRPAGDDKRRKRRESHNAVERRRRDNINDRITELAALIPEALLDTASMQKASASRSRSRNGRGGGDRDRDDSPDASMQNDSMQSDTPGFPSISSQFTPAQLAQQAAANKPNKGVILTKSVEYIRYLQQLVQMQAERNRELEIRVRLLESGGNSHLPPAFNPAAASGGTCVPINTTTNGLVGSPGIPLGSGGSMRSLPPLEEGENAMDEGTGLSHKRDQFTARRSASRNSMNANDQPVLQQLPKNMHVETGKKTSPPVEPLPRQDILTTQDWIDSQLAAEMQDDSNNSQQDQQSNKMNGMTTNGQQNSFIASPTISSTTSTTMLMMQNGHAHLNQQHQQHQDEHDNHQMTFEDLLQVGRNNRVISDSEGRDSLASESPLPSVGKMEEDDENALGMQL